MTALIGFIVAAILAAAGLVLYTQQSAAPHNTVEGTSQGYEQQQTLTIINRSGQGLRNISKNDILAMGNVQELNLSRNQLSGTLPAEIRHLSNLEVLNISNNTMTGLPAELGQLSKLRILNASHSQLTGIPHELGNLQNLEVLDLSGNTISAFDLNEIRKKLPSTTEIIL